MRIVADAPRVAYLPREQWRPVPGRERVLSVSSRGRLYDHRRRSLVTQQTAALRTGR
jgi:hypothetical protein